MDVDVGVAERLGKVDELEGGVARPRGVVVVAVARLDERLDEDIGNCNMGPEQNKGVVTKGFVI